MAVQPNLPVGVTTITPPAVDTLVKTIKVLRTDTARFKALALPKYAVVSGVYVLGGPVSNAASTATITVGTSTAGTEILNEFDVKGTTGAGYNPGGASAGSAMGTQLTADTMFNAVYAETGTASSAGGPWYVKIEYYIPQQGSTY